MISTPVEARSAMEQSIGYLLSIGKDLAEIEYLVRQSVLEQALTRARGNQRRAASALGVHRNTLSRERAAHAIPEGFGRSTYAGSCSPTESAARCRVHRLREEGAQCLVHRKSRCCCLNRPRGWPSGAIPGPRMVCLLSRRTVPKQSVAFAWPTLLLA